MLPPAVSVNVVARGTGEIIQVGGGIVMRVLEDGSNTDNRLAAVHFTLPPRTLGPPQHWHQASSPSELLIILSDFNSTIRLLNTFRFHKHHSMSI